MVLNASPQELIDLKQTVEQLIEVHKYSSITEISEKLEIDEDSTRELIQDLIEDGSLEGRIDESGSRFFSSNVKVSTAPSLPSGPDIEVQRPDLGNGKYGLVAGFVLFIISEVLPDFSIGFLAMEDLRGILIIISLAIIIASLMFLSRKEVVLTSSQ